MSPKEFWNLSWYDWGLWSLRICNNQKQIQRDRELTMEMTRSFMTFYGNSLRTKESDRLYTKEEFFHLSYDTTEEKAKETDEEIMKRIKQRFKKYLKNG